MLVFATVAWKSFKGKFTAKIDFPIVICRGLATSLEIYVPISKIWWIEHLAPFAKVGKRLFIIGVCTRFNSLVFATEAAWNEDTGR